MGSFNQFLPRWSYANTSSLLGDKTFTALRLPTSVCRSFIAAKERKLPISGAHIVRSSQGTRTNVVGGERTGRMRRQKEMRMWCRSGPLRIYIMPTSNGIYLAASEPSNPIWSQILNRIQWQRLHLVTYDHYRVLVRIRNRCDDVRAEVRRASVSPGERWQHGTKRV